MFDSSRLNQNQQCELSTYFVLSIDCLDEFFTVACTHTQEVATKKSCISSKNFSRKTISSSNCRMKICFQRFSAISKASSFFAQIASLCKWIGGIQWSLYSKIYFSFSSISMKSGKFLCNIYILQFSFFCFAIVMFHSWKSLNSENIS